MSRWTGCVLSQPEHELATVYEPMINLILQGSKSMTVGEQTFDYDPATCFVMSVQYQKRIRLMHARTLMVARGSSVAAAAYDVCYESATQFSREYARLFGMAPLRDAARMLAHTRNA